MSYTQGIDHVVETIQGLPKDGPRCSLLIGAGCSVTAGIPIARDFVTEIEKRYPQKYRLADPKIYPRCMRQLLPRERRDLIANYVDTALINWAHIAIACLIREGWVDRVLTTNFDPLVVRACALLNEFPAVYDLVASPRYKASDVPDKAIIYLHGQRTGFVLVNTDEEATKYSEGLAPVFEDATQGRPCIVVGYSGESDPVFNHLAGMSTFDEGLYWVGYKDSEPALHVRDALLKRFEGVYYVPGFDADGFFVTLARKLGVFPPDLIAKPFTHLDDCLQTLTPEFTEPGQDTPTEAYRGTRDLISQAIQRYEKKVVEDTEDAKREIDEASSLSVLQSLMMAGDYDAVISEYEKAPQEASQEIRNLAARAHLLRGNALLERGQAAQGEEAGRLLAEAIENYQAALAIKSDYHVALHNWGLALYEQAKRKAGAEADHLFEEACKKYEAAVKIKPDFHEALNNWGAALGQHAAMPHMAERSKEMFLLAKEKALEVERIKPGEGAYNAACASARLGEEEECRKWLETALEHGTLLKRSRLEKDPDLASVRDAAWFKALLEKAPQ